MVISNTLHQNAFGLVFSLFVCGDVCLFNCLFCFVLFCFVLFCFVLFFVLFVCLVGWFFGFVFVFGVFFFLCLFVCLFIYFLSLFVLFCFVLFFLLCFSSIFIIFHVKKIYFGIQMFLCKQSQACTE